MSTSQTSSAAARTYKRAENRKSYRSYRSGVASVGNRVQCLLPQTLKDQLKLENKCAGAGGKGLSQRWGDVYPGATGTAATIPVFDEADLSEICKATSHLLRTSW